MPTLRLSDVTRPGEYRCVTVECNGDAMIRLKRLGICDGRTINVMQPGNPMVLQVIGSRLGVSRRLAESVVVQSICQVATSPAVPADTIQNV